MPRKGSEIKEEILRYLEDKENPVTFSELYGVPALKQFSPQGIRNRVYKMIKEGMVKKLRIPKGSRRRNGEGWISFKLRKQ